MSGEVCAPPSNEGCWKRFRKYAIRPAKSILSSFADIAGDWVFYINVAGYAGSRFEKYEISLFVFAIVSSVLGVLLLLNIYIANKRCKTQRQAKWGSIIKSILACEILIEDIPQFVLTYLVTADRGGRLSTYAVFNITTSAFNFVLNLLDLIQVEEEEAAGDSNGEGGYSEGEEDLEP